MLPTITIKCFIRNLTDLWKEVISVPTYGGVIMKKRAKRSSKFGWVMLICCLTLNQQMIKNDFKNPSVLSGHTQYVQKPNSLINLLSSLHYSAEIVLKANNG